MSSLHSLRSKVLSNNPLKLEEDLCIKTQRTFKVGCTYIFKLKNISVCNDPCYKIISAKIVIPVYEQDFYQREKKSRGLIKGV